MVRKESTQPVELRVEALNVHRILRRAAHDTEHRPQSTGKTDRSQGPGNGRLPAFRS